MSKQTETKEEMDDHRHGGIQVIARSSKIMRALSAHPQGLSLAGIAIEVGLPRSTVQRIIYALEAENIVEPVGPGGGFRIGPALSQMMHQTQADIVSIVRPHLERLCLQLQETVCLSRANGLQNDILDQFVGTQPLRIVIPMGSTAPLQMTASGKALLARMSDDKVLECLGTDLPPRTRYSKSVAELKAELAEIRHSGFAYEHEEYTEGICAVATSIGTYRGTYALTILAPTSRMLQKQESFKSVLSEIRITVERLVGVATEYQP